MEPRCLTSYPSPSKREGLRVCKAIAEGAARVDGWTASCAAPGTAKLREGAALFYGCTDHSMPLIALCERENREWFYMDNAYYWGRGEYKRVTRKSFMHSGDGDYPPDRFRAFGVTIKPWRASGAHILLTTQSDLFYRQRLGVSRDEWCARVIAELREHTDREVIICHKPPSNKLARHEPHSREFEPLLDGAWAMVTHSSSTACKALADGVPVLWLGGEQYQMVRRLCAQEYAQIEAPPMLDDRERVFSALAYNQWTREELKNGKCWRELAERHYGSR